MGILAVYNYPVFPEDLDHEAFSRFPSLLKVGSPAPDGEVTRLDDRARVRLSDYWGKGHLVIEFGSFT